MKNKNMIIIILIVFILIGCSPTKPPPENSSIDASIVVVSSTEAWLKINTEGESGDIIITSNEKEIKSFTAPKNDTVVYIDSLLPNKNYTFQALVVQNGKIIGKSEKVTSATLDTTSHDLTWQTFTFVGGGSSVFNDIAIINDTLAYAVGEVYLDDSSGYDSQPYSVGEWNGNIWKLIKIYDSDNNLIPSVRGIYSFNLSDIWLTDGGIYHWDGVSKKMNESFDRISLIGGNENGQSVNKLWGINSGNLYGIGNNGMITHYINNKWQKIESGTNTIITDIWGVINSNDEVTVYCPASSFFYSR